MQKEKQDGDDGEQRRYQDERDGQTSQAQVIPISSLYIEE
jgi:hypothetical protein